MAIATFAALQTYVTEYLELDAATVARLPDLIADAEAEMRRVITSPLQETVAFESTVAAQQSLALPADFAQLRGIRINDDHTLPQVSYSVLQNGYSADSVSGEPLVFALYGQSLWFGPIPDTAYTITIDYLANLAALSNANTSNWLLTAHPDAYKWSTMVQVETWLRDLEAAAIYQAKFDRVAEQINRQGNRYRSSTPTRVRPSVVV